ncbi:NAD(P)-dependent oxidoreductase [Bacteroidota bacterium]
MKSSTITSRRNFMKGLAIGGAGLTLPHISTGSIGRDVEMNISEKLPRLPLKIALTSGLGPDFLKSLGSISNQISIIEPDNENARMSAAKDSDVWLGYIRKEEFSAAKNLKWIHSTSAGVEGYLFPELINSDVQLTNAKGCYGPAIGEHTIGLLLALTRNIASKAQSMKNNDWSGGGNDNMVEMKNWTVGIIGFGGIGKQVARRARGMDMRIVAMDIVPMYKEQIGDICDEIYLFHDNGLDKLLKQSDVIVSAAPHTQDTEGMFGEEQFNQMRKGSYFINVSRGKLVKTDELMNALTSGHLAGAGLDVTDPEPLPSDHRLWSIPNVIITPHISGRSQHSYNRVQEVFVDNVKRFVNGFPLLNLVDKIAGF